MDPASPGGPAHVLPPDPHQFAGVIAETYAESTQDWPPPARPPRRAPNIVVVMLDDLGFGQLSCYGGSIDAPHIGELAANGIALLISSDSTGRG